MSLQTPNPTSIKEIQKLYVIKGDKEVKSFIESNPYLLDVLKEAKLKIDEILGSEKKELLLELFVSPEDGEESLIVTIDFVTLNCDDAFELLNKVYSSWWLTHPMRKEHKILFSIRANQ